MNPQVIFWCGLLTAVFLAGTILVTAVARICAAYEYSQKAWAESNTRQAMQQAMQIVCDCEDEEDDGDEPSDGEEPDEPSPVPRVKADPSNVHFTPERRATHVRQAGPGMHVDA